MNTTSTEAAFIAGIGYLITETGTGTYVGKFLGDPETLPYELRSTYEGPQRFVLVNILESEALTYAVRNCPICSTGSPMCDPHWALCAGEREEGDNH